MADIALDFQFSGVEGGVAASKMLTQLNKALGDFSVSVDQSKGISSLGKAIKSFVEDVGTGVKFSKAVTQVSESAKILKSVSSAFAGVDTSNIKNSLDNLSAALSSVTSIDAKGANATLTELVKTLIALKPLKDVNLGNIGTTLKDLGNGIRTIGKNTGAFEKLPSAAKALKEFSEQVGTIASLKDLFTPISNFLRALNNIGNIGENLNAASVGLKGFSNEVGALYARLPKANIALEKFAGAVLTVKLATTNLKDMAKNMKEGFSDLINNISSEFSLLRQQMATNAASMEASMKKTLGSIDEAGRGMNDITPKGNKVSQMLQRMGIDARTTHSFVRGLSSGFNLLWLTWGKIVPLLGGASVSHGIVKTFQIGSEVEMQLRIAEQIGMGYTKAGEKIEDFEKKSLKMLQNINAGSTFTMLELSNAYLELGRAGRTMEESVAVLKSSADLAVTGGTDLETATNLVRQASEVFGISMDEAADTAAKLEKATNMFPLSLQDLVGSMKYASETNTRFKQSLEDTLAVIGVLSKSGLKANMAGTATINMLRDLAGRSGPAIAAMKELDDLTGKITGKKISLIDDEGKTKRAIEVIKDVVEATKLLDPKTADRILGKFFSDRGGRSYYALLREDLDKVLEAVGDIEGATGEQLAEKAKAAMDTGMGQMRIFQSYIQNVMTEVYDRNAGKFKDFFKGLIDVISSPAFTGALDTLVGAGMAVLNLFVRVIPYVVGLTKALLPLAAGFLAFKGSILAAGWIATLTASVMGFVARSLSFVVASYAMGGSLGVLSGLAGTATGAIRTLWLAMLANPITAVVALLVAAATALYVFRDDIKLTEDGLVTLGDFFGGFSDAVKDRLEDLADFSSRTWDIISGSAESGADRIKSATDDGTGYSTTGWGNFLVFMGAMGDAVAKVVFAIANTFVQLGAIVLRTFAAIGRELGGFAADMAGIASSAAKKDWAGVATGAKGMVKNLLGSHKRVAIETFDAGRDAALSFKDGFASIERVGLQSMVEEAIDRSRLKSVERAEATAKQKRQRELEETLNKGLGTIAGDGSGGGRGGNSAHKQRMSDAQKYIQDLQKQLDKTKEISEAEKLHNTVKLGNIKFTAEELQQAEALAEQLDREYVTQLKKTHELELQNQLYKDQVDMAKMRHDLEASAATRGMGKKAADRFKSDADFELARKQQQAEKLRTNTQQIEELLNGRSISELSGRDLESYNALREKSVQLLLQEMAVTEEMRAIRQADYEQRMQQEADWQAGLSSGLQNWLEEARDVYSQMQGVATSALSKIEDGLLSLVTTGKVDVRAMIAAILSDLIRMLVRYTMQLAITYAMKKMFDKKEEGDSKKDAVKKAAEWATPAALVSLATQGGNAISASAGILSTVGLSKALAGFADGGYTGAGGKYQPAGIVHAGEGVFSQEDIRAMGGPAAFEAFRRSLHESYSTGGIVRTPATIGQPSNITVNLIESETATGVVEQRETESGTILDIFVASIRSGGEAAEVLEGTYGLARVGR